MTGRRIAALDALRGVAALSVLIYHTTLRYPRFMLDLPMDGGDFLPGLTQEEAGTVPVLWFFIISGFVITWTVGRCRAPMDFVVSRVTRLYPAFWAALAVSAALLWLAPLPGPVLTLPRLLMNLTMLQEYVGVASIDGVYWSLTVELLFYVYALTLFAVGLWRYVHLAAFAWAAACLAWVVLTHAGVGVPWRVQQLLTLQYGPFFAAGMALYRLWRQETPGWGAATLVLCAAAVLLQLRPVPAATCVLAAAAIGLSAEGRLGWLAARPLLWLGAISYPLYLCHQTASYVAIRALDAAGLPHAAGICVAIVLSLALAAAITFAVERPALRITRAAYRRLTRAPGAVPVPYPGQQASRSAPD